MFVQGAGKEELQPYKEPVSKQNLAMLKNFKQPPRLYRPLPPIPQKASPNPMNAQQLPAPPRPARLKNLPAASPAQDVPRNELVKQPAVQSRKEVATQATLSHNAEIMQQNDHDIDPARAERRARIIKGLKIAGWILLGAALVAATIATCGAVGIAIGVGVLAAAAYTAANIAVTGVVVAGVIVAGGAGIAVMGHR